MASKKSVFEVDVEGMRQLQASKPKWFIIRELLQNAMDENVTEIRLNMKWEGRGRAFIEVVDDSPEGFVDLADSYTLFKETRKRADSSKRGRFNLGEKQVLCMAEIAVIETTTGTISFDINKGTRIHSRKKTEKGSRVYVVVKMTHDEFKECVKLACRIIPDKGVPIYVSVNSEEITMVNSGKTLPTCTIYEVSLPTELKVDGDMRRVKKVTNIDVYKPADMGMQDSYLYELGIPICEIECDYSIDIRQKVPLSNDRDSVEPKFLKLVYAYLLNATHEELAPDQSSNLWVRTATTAPECSTVAVKDIITKRFGAKSLIANPFDKRSMDEAISGGYNVIHGSELSSEEWDRIKEDNLLESTSSKFKVDMTSARTVQPDVRMQRHRTLIKRIAYDLLTLRIEVTIVEAPDADTIADFGNNVMRINTCHIPDDWWEGVEIETKGQDTPVFYINQKFLDLIIHELGHSAGWHYEHSYHECITKLGSLLVIKAIAEPKYFLVATKQGTAKIYPV